MRKIIVLLCFTLFISACSSSTKTASKPEGVGQDIWNTGLTYAVIINEFLKEDIKISGGTLSERIGQFSNPDNKKDNTNAELSILDYVKELAIHAVSYQAFGAESSKKSYDEYFSKLESIYGKGSLIIENVDNDLYDEVIHEYSKMF
ncbi:hypothetical protein [Paenibacillus thermotolerans]|uniref:hypothetical protein n=1 Tax=Paenibacillus thermotolerans TaxID=3027807 RepID=UPI0023676382|nr:MULTISPECIES: hypothetical protein [unclassified Paenibacillus]